MAESVRSTRRRWFSAIAVAVLLASGAYLYLAADPLNSVERGLVGVWKERTPRRQQDVLAFSPDRRYFVNDHCIGTWRAVEGRLQVTPLSMRDIQIQMSLKQRLYFLARRPFMTKESKPAVTAAMTRSGPDAITLRPESGTDETDFDRVPAAPLPTLPRFDDIELGIDDDEP